MYVSTVKVSKSIFRIWLWEKFLVVKISINTLPVVIFNLMVPFINEFTINLTGCVKRIKEMVFF